MINQRTGNYFSRYIRRIRHRININYLLGLFIAVIIFSTIILTSISKKTKLPTTQANEISNEIKNSNIDINENTENPLSNFITTKPNEKKQNKSKKSKTEKKPNITCVPCKNLKKSYGNSSPNDVVITGVFGKFSKFDKFIRSLRSTGSKARVVVVSNTTFPNSFITKYSLCKIDFFIMKSPNNTMDMYPHSLRYIGYQQYFRQANQTFDRVLHADSFDVFFQRDPFSDAISKDHLYFVMEDIKIMNSSWNHGWLIRAYNETISDELGNFTVSCSGTVIGGFSQFITYLGVLLGHEPFWLNGRHSLDQAYHNYLLHTYAFEKAGIKPMFFGCNSPILTMHYCGRNGGENIKDGQIYSPNGQIQPAIVHQYPLFGETTKAIKKMCAK